MTNLQDTGIKKINVVLLQQWPSDGLKDIGIASVNGLLGGGGGGAEREYASTLGMNELDMNSQK